MRTLNKIAILILAILFLLSVMMWGIDAAIFWIVWGMMLTMIYGTYEHIRLLRAR